MVLYIDVLVTGSFSLLLLLFLLQNRRTRTHCLYVGNWKFQKLWSPDQTTLFHHRNRKKYRERCVFVTLFCVFFLTRFCLPESVVVLSWHCPGLGTASRSITWHNVNTEFLLYPLLSLGHWTKFSCFFFILTLFSGLKSAMDKS